MQVGGQLYKHNRHNLWAGRESDTLERGLIDDDVDLEEPVRGNNLPDNSEQGQPEEMGK